MSRRTEEYRSCCSLIEWWGYAHRAYKLPAHALLHVPNQAGGNAITGMHLKRMGVRAGCPDYLLLVPRGAAHGLAVEMKAADGVVSKEQREVLAYLQSAGYAVSVCYSSGEAREVIENYLRSK